jgi:hypothetical protein
MGLVRLSDMLDIGTWPRDQLFYFSLFSVRGDSTVSVNSHSKWNTWFAVSFDVNVIPTFDHFLDCQILPSRRHDFAIRKLIQAVSFVICFLSKYKCINSEVEPRGVLLKYLLCEVAKPYARLILRDEKYFRFILNCVKAVYTIKPVGCIFVLF